MIICSCNVISDTAIRDIVTTAATTFGSPAQVYDCLGCSVQCGLCSRSVKRILDEHSGETATAVVWPVHAEPTPCELMSAA
ncbi:hypothetical protein BRADO5452 [Bradyrhizobium sp. ORS 278]|nr:hypothetical protein BRADO5452 [Bradyrhizobium sp. ORS 278]